MRAAPPALTVIVPTVADAPRKDGLRRALGSILDQEGVAARPLVVINGDRFDPGFRAELEHRDDVGVHYQETGSLPLAIETGRGLVETPFFSYLDDDDYYLPGTMAMRVAPLLADPDIDAVVTNGRLRAAGGAERPIFPGIDQCQSDPALALSRSNWLASCGGTFRTATIGPEIFADGQKFYEWTLIAFRLAISGKRIRFLEDETFVVEETAGSLSKSEGYYSTTPIAIKRLLALKPPRPVADALWRKHYDAHHSVCAYHLRNGHRGAAWRHHLKSLGSRYGLLSYLPYTRRLLWPW